MNNGIEEMVREYTEAMSDLSLLERQLATELQKYVSWDIVNVSLLKRLYSCSMRFKRRWFGVIA